MSRNVNPLPHASMRWTELRTHAHVHSELPLFDPIAAARLVRWRALEDLKAKAQKLEDGRARAHARVQQQRRADASAERERACATARRIHAVVCSTAAGGSPLLDAHAPPPWGPYDARSGDVIVEDVVGVDDERGSSASSACSSWDQLETATAAAEARGRHAAGARDGSGSRLAAAAAVRRAAWAAESRRARVAAEERRVRAAGAAPAAGTTPSAPRSARTTAAGAQQSRTGAPARATEACDASLGQLEPPSAPRRTRAPRLPGGQRSRAVRTATADGSPATQ